MKKVEAVVKPFKLEEVKNALSNVGVRGLTVFQVQGFGRQRGHKSQYRGSEYTVELVPKTMIQVVVSDSLAVPAQEAIARVARTGELGDGKIFVYPLENVLKIRTGETGEDAI